MKINKLGAFYFCMRNQIFHTRDLGVEENLRSKPVVVFWGDILPKLAPNK